MRLSALLSLAFLAACGASVDSAAPPATGASTEMPAGAVVLPASAIPTILRQCSRQSPAAGESSWQPSAAEIVALETAAAAALRARQETNDPDWSGFPDNWRRQYVGLVRGGRRFIYGNAYPRDVGPDPRSPDQWRRAPVIVCDGGPSFFGVEYDVAGRRITQFAFNGGF
jgi:hypothetical protein